MYPREQKLNPKRSRNCRTLSVILEQSAIAAELLQKKRIEEFTSKELQELGLIYNEKSDYDNAKLFLNLALEKVQLETENLERYIIITNCHFGLANGERELGNNKEAIQHFTKASEECEKINHDCDEYQRIKYDIQRNLGIAYLKINEAKNAAQCFKIALDGALQSDKKVLVPAAQSYYGLALVLSGEHQVGFTQLEKARSLYPVRVREQSMDWAAHRYHMGLAYQTIGNHINAIAEFKESLRLRLQTISPQIGRIYFNSRVGDVHAGLGKSYLALGYAQEAEDWYRKALENYQALNDPVKIREIEALLPGKQKASQINYLRYGIGAAAALGVSLFAYRFLSNGSSSSSDIDKIGLIKRLI